MARKSHVSNQPVQNAPTVKRKVYDQYYPLEYLRKHPALADQILREYERDHGPLPKIRIQKNNRPHAQQTSFQEVRYDDANNRSRL